MDEAQLEQELQHQQKVARGQSADLLVFFCGSALIYTRRIRMRNERKTKKKKECTKNTEKMIGEV